MKQTTISPLTLPAKQKPTRTVRYAVVLSGAEIVPSALVVKLQRETDLLGLEEKVSEEFEAQHGLQLEFDCEMIVRGEINSDLTNIEFDEEITFSTSHGRGHSLSLSVKGKSVKGDYKLTFIGTSDTSDEEELEVEFSKKMQAALEDYEASILSTFSISKPQLDYIIKATGKPSLASFEGSRGQEELISLIEEFKNVMSK